MIQRRMVAECRSRRGKAGFMFGERIGIQDILAGKILNVHERIRSRDAGTKRRCGGNPLRTRAIGM